MALAVMVKEAVPPRYRRTIITIRPLVRECARPPRDERRRTSSPTGAPKHGVGLRHDTVFVSGIKPPYLEATVPSRSI